jgi:hypothetical protein
MKLKGPLVTLAAGVALAAVLFGLNVRATSTGPTAGEAAGAAPATAATGGAPAGTPTPAASSASAAQAIQATYAGSVAGGGASIAVAVRDGRAIAYLCDGRRTEAWLQGSATAGQMSLTSAKGATLRGTYDAGHATGTVSVAGRQWTFSVAPVHAPSGLYRATANVRNARVQAGWIIVNGVQVGILDTDDAPAAAPRLDLTTLSADVGGTPVTAVPIDGTTGSGF